MTDRQAGGSLLCYRVSPSLRVPSSWPQSWRSCGSVSSGDAIMSVRPVRTTALGCARRLQQGFDAPLTLHVTVAAVGLDGLSKSTAEAPQKSQWDRRFTSCPEYDARG